MTLIIFKDESKKMDVMFTEWLVTNGIGGFACGTLCGALTRKYHSLLNAALPAPYGRTIMLNYVEDTLIFPDKSEYNLSSLSYYDKKETNPCYLIEFRLDNGLPIWTYEVNGCFIEKRLLLINRQNTLHIAYKVLSSNFNITLKWRPFFHFRLHEQPVNIDIPEENYVVAEEDSHYTIACPNFPLLRLYNDAQTVFTKDAESIDNVFYELEARRGYESVGRIKSPGYFAFPLTYDKETTVIASCEPWSKVQALTPKHAHITEKIRRKNLLKAAGKAGENLTTAKLVLAADQFIITPTTRYDDMIRLQAAGEEVKTIIAGFPWFTDWGRDTMISLEGLTLVTGRSRDAYSILQTFSHYVHDGLIPNMFPDGEVKGIYNTADASLWFFHAIDRYIAYTKDEEILEFLLPTLYEIIDSHIKGTLFGIHVDEDGLLVQGEKGFQLTWMDAKVGDWVVTPRSGKAVEINALWYNALRLYEEWTKQPLELANKCYESFNAKFWCPEEQYLYDVIEGENGNDIALRPNQIFSISLKHPALNKQYWKPVLDAVEKHLLTPFGLRTLSPIHPDYKSYYDGDLLARDAAYHQGTVWPWLIGPYIDAWLKVYPDDLQRMAGLLSNFENHLNSDCMGTIGEIFDAAPPYKARGCFAQAWSVAEILRSLAKVSSLTP